MVSGRNFLLEPERSDLKPVIGVPDFAVSRRSDPLEAAASVIRKFFLEELSAGVFHFRQRLASEKRTQAVEDDETDAVNKATLEAEVRNGPVDERGPAEKVSKRERNLATDPGRSIPAKKPVNKRLWSLYLDQELGFPELTLLGIFNSFVDS